MNEIDWLAGPATAADPAVADRIGAHAPATVAALPPGVTLLDALRHGRVDALMLPTLPVESFGASAPFRQLIPDYRQAEAAYVRRLGFVPGIHLFALRREVVQAHPGIQAELVEVLARAYADALRRRLDLLDTTPWLIAELHAMADTVGLDYNPYRLDTAWRSAAMLADELVAQGLCPRQVGPDELFAGCAEDA